MPESIIITLQRPMPLVKRISEVRRQIRGWLKSLEKPLYHGKYTLQLTKCVRNNREYCYHYSVIQGKELTAFRAKAGIIDTCLEDLSDNSLIPTTYPQIEGQETDL